MKYIPKEKRITGSAALIILLLLIISSTVIIVYGNKLVRENHSRIAEIDRIRAETERLQEVNKRQEQELKQIQYMNRLVETKADGYEEVKVLITNYYPDDGSSGTTTASGLSVDDFIEVEGIYTYNGYDVLATANTTRWDKPLKAGYRAYELYDIVVYELNGELRNGIVLDVCGACHGVKGEELQRIDVFTTHSIIGKVEGIILEKTGEEK